GTRCGPFQPSRRGYGCQQHKLQRISPESVQGLTEDILAGYRAYSSSRLLPKRLTRHPLTKSDHCAAAVTLLLRSLDNLRVSTRGVVSLPCESTCARQNFSAASSKSIDPTINEQRGPQ